MVVPKAGLGVNVCTKLLDVAVMERFSVDTGKLWATSSLQLLRPDRAVQLPDSSGAWGKKLDGQEGAGATVVRDSTDGPKEEAVVEPKAKPLPLSPP